MVAIIAILASIILIAINPARNLAQTNNAQRWLDVNAIEKAINQYAIDSAGQVPSTITLGSTEICKTDAPSCSGLVDLSVLTLSKRYVTRVPSDPTSASTNGTGYYVNRDSYGRVTVTAPFAQLGATIEISL